MKCNIVPKHSAPFALLQAGNGAKVTLILSHEVFMDNQSKDATVLVANLIVFRAEKKSSVVVVTSKCVVMTMGWIHTAKLAQQILLAEGIYQGFIDFPFQKYLGPTFRINLLYPISTCVLVHIQIYQNVS